LIVTGKKKVGILIYYGTLIALNTARNQIKRRNKMNKIREKALALLSDMKSLEYRDYQYQDDDTKKRYDELVNALQKFDGE
jgi:phage-related tail protein